MKKKTRIFRNLGEEFLTLHSVDEAFIFRGGELILLSLFVSVVNFYFPGRDILIVLLAGIAVTLVISFLLYQKYRARMAREDESE
jgi:hypothetical protein